MVFVFFIYGFPFFLLWMVIFVYPKRISKYSLPRNMWMIALFAMFHGIHEWAEMLRLFHAEPHPLEIVELVALPLSFYFPAYLRPVKRESRQAACAARLPWHCPLPGSRSP